MILCVTRAITEEHQMEMVNSSRKCLFKKINYFPYLKGSKRHCLEGNLHVQWLGSMKRQGVHTCWSMKPGLGLER